MRSPANDHDPPVAKQMFDQIGSWNGRLFADKASMDAQWTRDLLEQHNLRPAPPHRRVHGEVNLFPGRSAWETFINSVLQKIEIFFSRLDDVTHIQNASKVRSLKGLLLHIFGGLAAALLLLVL